MGNQRGGAAFSNIMDKIKLFLLLGLFVGIVYGVLAILPEVPGHRLVSQLINLVFPITLTPEDLHTHYAEQKVKILVVPGHDPKYYGTEFWGMHEADLTLKTAEYLYNQLKEDPRFEVWTARDFKTGEYTSEFTEYFINNREAIRKFKDDSMLVMDALERAGIAEDKSTLNHGFAKEEIALQLYGLNKWANEHDIDIALHLHFNNYPHSPRSAPGEYTGFAIYVPESQYPNGLTSRDLAKPILEELRGCCAISNMPFELGGIVEDQDLIALGANGTRDGAALLIEYGYLYEGKFAFASVRNNVFKDLAWRTYLGIKKYFNDAAQLKNTTTLLPYTWVTPLSTGMRGSPAILSLQAALKSEGLYPPPAKDLRSCPVNGNFGPCVEAAVKLFQEKYRNEILGPNELSTGSGIVGPSTISKLNQLFGI